jgi:hypothetical protein
MKRARLHESGSLRLGLVLVIAALALLCKGGQSLYTAVTNRNPTTMGYDQYVQSRPKATWLVLTNCTTFLTQAAFKRYEYSQVPTELYLPVRSQEEDSEGQKVHVLLATKDPALLSTFREMQELKNAPREKVLAWAKENKGRLVNRRNVSGLVRFGIDLKESERTKLASLMKNASDDFIILEEGSKPSMGEGLAMSLGGLMLIGGMTLYACRSRESTAAEI